MQAGLRLKCTRAGDDLVDLMRALPRQPPSKNIDARGIQDVQPGDRGNYLRGSAREVLELARQQLSKS